MWEDNIVKNILFIFFIVVWNLFDVRILIMDLIYSWWFGDDNMIVFYVLVLGYLD